MSMLEGRCPSCAKALQIPGELTEFSCLYCGVRLTPSALITAPETTAEDAAAAYELFRQQILHAAVDFQDAMEHMSKVNFFSYFDRYYAECKPAFEALERWALSGDRTQRLSDAAAELIAQVEAWFPTQKAWRFRPRRSELIERTKFTIAIFLVPAVQRCSPAIGQDFAAALRERWMEQHPDSPFVLATYEELVGGFRKHTFCFVTTAVCEQRGLPDDCEMLTRFRAFRDGYLRACPDGPALIAAYYQYAPGIVCRINYCQDAPRIYDRLYRRYLAPCDHALLAGNPAKCKELYCRMMRRLGAPHPNA